MSGAAEIRAGRATIEIGARDGAFHQAMNRVQAKMRAVAQTMQRVGTGMSLAGLGLGMPLVQAARQAATFEDALLGMKAAARLSDEDIKRLGDEAKRLSASMGVGPGKIAQGFMELAKAGMEVETIMAGAGKAATEFFRVSGVDVQTASEMMTTTMGTFGASVQEVVDSLSAASDSSETSISAMVESFSQMGSAAASFNQSVFGVSQALVALAHNNIKGEEAGTAIKTMLTKLVAPTDDAKEALGRLGLSVADFRDEMGRLLPMAQIAGVFERALKGMDGNARDLMLSQQALVDVFEQRGIKVITAFANIGEKGFRDIERKMKEALPVSEKFKIVMSGISGQFERLSSGMDRVSIAFGEAVGGSLIATTDVLVKMMDALARFIEAFPMFAVGAAAVAAGLVAIGTAAIFGTLMLKGFAVVFAALTSPIGLATAAVVAFVAYNYQAFGDLETAGMRLQSVWRKVGIYIASAFDSQVSDNLDTLLKEVDDDFEKWKRKSEKEKQEQKENAVNPDKFRKPMVGNPLEGQVGTKQNVSSAGTFGSAIGLGIGPQLADPMRQVEQNTKRAADGIDKIADQIKEIAPRAAAGAVTANGITLPRTDMAGGIGSVAKACQDTAEAVKSSNRLLERVANKLDGMRIAYA